MMYPLPSISPENETHHIFIISEGMTVCKGKWEYRSLRSSYVGYISRGRSEGPVNSLSPVSFIRLQRYSWKWTPGVSDNTISERNSKG